MKQVEELAVKEIAQYLLARMIGSPMAGEFSTFLEKYIRLYRGEKSLEDRLFDLRSIAQKMNVCVDEEFDDNFSSPHWYELRGVMERAILHAAQKQNELEE